MKLISSALGASLLLWLSVGCGATTKPNGGTIGTIACGSETRPQIDCTSEVSYQGVSTAGGLSVANLGSGHAKYEETALRRVDAQTEQFFAMQGRLCRDYNACAIDRDAYQRDSRDIRDKVSKIPELRDAIKNAKSDDDRSKALDQLYRATVPANQRVEEVTFKMSLDAELPGGQRVSAQPGASLPTETRVAFNVEVSADAYVYIFQKAPDGALTVLFPNDKIGTKNPLPGGTTARIPPGSSRFRLNDKDIGTEKVFIAVSRKELTRLGDALARVNSGQVTSLTGDGTLQSIGNVDDAGGPTKTCSRGLELEGAAPAAGGGCTKSRGLELDDGPGSSGGAAASGPPSLAARTEPGDSMIVKVFSFEHLSTQQFQAKGSQVGGGKVKTRGVVVEE